MASYKSNFLDNALLNHVMNAAAMPSFATLFVALFTARPTAAGTGGTEVSGGSYARASVTANTTNFPTTATQQIVNATNIAFPSATASWGTVTSFALMTASSGGNFLYIGDIVDVSNAPTTISVSSGTQIQFVAGSLTVKES